MPRLGAPEGCSSSGGGLLQSLQTSFQNVAVGGLDRGESPELELRGEISKLRGEIVSSESSRGFLK